MGKTTISEQQQVQLKLAKQYLTKGTELWNSYDYEEALVEMRQALVIREAVLGKFNKKTAKTYFSMGCAHHFNAKCSLALICLRRTLRIHLHKANAKQKQQTLIQSTKDYIIWCLKKKSGGAISDEQCERYVAQLVKAIHHEQQGDASAEAWDHEGALKSYNLALQEETSAVGTTHIDIADLYIKIADMLILCGNDQDAFAYYQQAVAIYTEALGPNHPYTQTTLEKMDLAAAMAQPKQQRQSAPSKQHQQVSQAKNIGISVQDYTKTTLEKMDQAAAMAQTKQQSQSAPSKQQNQQVFQAKNIGISLHDYTKTTLDKMDPTTAMAQTKQQSQSAPSKEQNQQLFKANNIGISVQDLLQSDRATNLVDKAVKHFHRDRTEFRKQTTQLYYYDSDGQYFWKGMGLYKHHQYAEALVAFRRVWRIRTQVYGRDHGQSQQVLQTMTLILRRIQMTQKMKKTTQQYQQELCLAVDAETNGDVLRDTGQVIPALRKYQRAAALEASAVGTHHLEYAALQDKIGDCYLQALQLQTATNDDNDNCEDNDDDKVMATKSYRIALLIYTSALGRGHPVTKTIIEKMECET